MGSAQNAVSCSARALPCSHPLERRAPASTDPSGWCRRRSASRCPAGSSRLCCRLPGARRPARRAACPRPTGAGFGRRVATARAPDRIRLPDRRSRCDGSRRRYIDGRRCCRRAALDVLAATASTRATPLWRSNTTGSPVCASTAVMSIARSGQRWLGSRAATVARHRDCPEPSEPIHRSAAAPILRRMSAASAAAAMMRFAPLRVVHRPVQCEHAHPRIPPQQILTGAGRGQCPAPRMSASSRVRARAGIWPPPSLRPTCR